MTLHTDGEGHWRERDGRAIAELDGCRDIDIWPTPFTNSFPIRRETLALGERRQFRMAWVFAPDLTVHAQPQAYTRLAESSTCSRISTVVVSGLNLPWMKTASWWTTRACFAV